MMDQHLYSEISIDIFMNMTEELPFDVFIQLVSGKFTKIFNRSDKIDKSRIQSYLDKGVKTLYILKKERREYIAATERFVKKILTNEPISSADAQRAVEELTEQTMYSIFEDKVFDDQDLRRAQDITKIYINTLKTDPKVLTQFIQLGRNETYMVRHSIATSIIAILIAKADSNTSDKTLQIVGLGGLLHDIGMSMLPQQVTDVDRKLSPQEWVQVKTHPDLSLKLIENSKDFPQEVSRVLVEHHENYDGSGYPKGIKGEDIFYPARIVAIADCFSALTTKRAGRSLFTPDDAIALLKTEIHRYDPKLIDTFEKLLSPQKRKKTAA